MYTVKQRLLSVTAAVIFTCGGNLVPALAQATSGSTPPPIVHYHHTDGAPTTTTAHRSHGNPQQWTGSNTGAVAASTIRPPQVNLDLSSTSASSTAGNFASTHPVTITLGGSSVAVTAGMSLTAAERVAISQVLQTGTQMLVLGSQGNALGGSLTIGSRLSQRIASLIIPQGVTVIDNVSKGSVLNLSGDLSNSGTLYVLSSNPSVTSAVISASNIYNQQGGLLSSVVPVGGLAGYSAALNSLHLTLNAVNDVTNAGVISSSGNLSVNAGGSITNALPAGVTGTPPVMQAMGNLNLSSAAGNIVNSGLMAATTGNINLTSQSTTALAINNAGGTLQALQGSINLRDQNYAGTADTTLTGGDVLSQSLNLYAGGGTTNVDVGQLSGVVNATGYAVHVLADTDTLTLGDINLSGDPTFYNDSTSNNNGAIDITGDITVNEDLTIAAVGNVETTGTSSLTISTNESSGSINIFAGVGISTTSCAGCTAGPTSLSGTFANGGGGVPVPPLPALPSTIVITLTGASAGGGNIDFSSITGSNGITLDTHNNFSSPTPGFAGHIVLVAGQGTTSQTGGLILMPNSTLNASSADPELGSSGGNGSVAIIAGGSNGTSPSIEVQNIVAGTLTIGTFQADYVAGVTANGNGTITGLSAPVTFQPAGQVEVFSGGAVSGSTILIETSKFVNNGAISFQCCAAAGVNPFIRVDDGLTTNSAGLTISGTGTFDISTLGAGFLTFQSNTEVIFSGMSQTVTDSHTGGFVYITAPLVEATNTGSPAILSAPNIVVTGDVADDGNANVTFGSVGGPATIELNGPVTVDANNVTITAGTTLESNSNFTFGFNALTSPSVATFTLNGTLQGTATGDTITIYGLGALTMAGTPQNPITVPNGTITVEAGPTDTLTFAGNYTIGQNDSTLILVGYQGSNLGNGGPLVINDNVNLTLQDNTVSATPGQQGILISTPLFELGANAFLTLGFGGQAWFYGALASSMTIMTKGGSNGTIENANGALNVVINNDYLTVPVTFASSNSSPTTLTIWNFNPTSGGLIVQGPTVTINSNVSILYLNNRGSTSGSVGVEINTNTLNVNGTLKVNTGTTLATGGVDIWVQGFGVNNALTVNMGPGSLLEGDGAGAGVQFNDAFGAPPATGGVPNFGPGPITVTGPGVISAPNDGTVGFNLPFPGLIAPVSVTVNVKQIIATGTGNFLATIASGSSVSITTSVGDLDFNANQAIVTNQGTGTSGGPITISANGGQIVALGTPIPGEIMFDSQGNGTGHTGGAVNLSASSGMVLGSVNSSGGNGALPGPISLTSGNGHFMIQSGSSILADTNNSSNTNPHLGPLIEFQSPVALTIINDGTIQATSGATPGTSGSGRIGFNGGPANNVTVSGSGTVHAGDYVAVGNQQPITDLTNPIGVLGSAGTITVSPSLTITGSNLTISPFVALPVITPAAVSVVSVPQPVQLIASLPSNEEDESALFAGRIATDFTNPLNLLQGQYEDRGQLATTPEGLLAGVLTNTSDFTASEVMALTASGIQGSAGAAANTFMLNVGTVVFAPGAGSITVDTRQGALTIPAGAVVLVIARGDGDVAVFDLHDRSDGVSLSAAGQNLALQPGQEVLVTDNTTANFDSLDRGSKIGYRNVTSEKLDNGKRAFSSEFSIITAAAAVKPLRQLLNSHNPQDRATAHAILKDAVLLNDISSTQGAFNSSNSRLNP